MRAGLSGKQSDALIAYELRSSRSAMDKTEAKYAEAAASVESKYAVFSAVITVDAEQGKEREEEKILYKYILA